MGSAAYPGENDLDAFLDENGGSTVRSSPFCCFIRRASLRKLLPSALSLQNAFTELEHTCFQLEVEPHALPEALHRLAACFAEPLFAASSVQREMQVMWFCMHGHV